MFDNDFWFLQFITTHPAPHHKFCLLKRFRISLFFFLFFLQFLEIMGILSCQLETSRKQKGAQLLYNPPISGCTRLKKQNSEAAYAVMSPALHQQNSSSCCNRVGSLPSWNVRRAGQITSAYPTYAAAEVGDVTQTNLAFKIICRCTG
jgi:hypothetical protein